MNGTTQTYHIEGTTHGYLLRLEQAIARGMAINSTNAIH